MNNDRKKTTHPSYGVMSFSKVNGGNRPFYGSELTPDNYVQMTLHESSQESGLTSDHYYENKRLVQVRMTSNQFAEILTNMNSTGIPVTIERLPDGPVETLTHKISKTEFIHNEFVERMEQYTQRTKEYMESITLMTKKSSVSKKDIREIESMMGQLTQEIDKNIPFFTKCFQEMMDKVVVEAKTTIQDAINQKIHSTGLQELFKQNNLLIGLGGNSPEDKSI